MKFEIIHDPVEVIIIRDVFSKEVNKSILEESIKNESSFKEAMTIDKNVSQKYRNNTTSMYDIMYAGNRNESILLKSIDEMFKLDSSFNELLLSSKYPVSEFGSSNFHETQVSRYGDDGQSYKYHIDRFTNTSRQTTMVYYFNEEPKKYKGGKLVLTDSPIIKGETVDINAKTLSIDPENNMAVIFPSGIPHMVEPTTSSNVFSEGRLSVNIWIGRK
jgi:Rps23 Pro-64 3,4-dihydroxylase Tpa1-like proline 4-hydroxylase|tara:strand:- start:1040 stop:1690 length:651 start_codon:yes stop_codon:yes gene_type:complete